MSSLMVRHRGVGHPRFPVTWSVLALVSLAATALGVITLLLTPSEMLFWSVFVTFALLCGMQLLTGRGRRANSDPLSPAAPFSLVMFVMFGLGSLYGWTGL